jgi:hypothetical protein
MIQPALFMQKIKDKSRSEAKTQSEAWGKKIKVSHLQTIFNICF